MSNTRSYQIAFQLGASMNSSMRTAFANANRNLSDTQNRVAKLNEGSGNLTRTIGGLSAGVIAAGAAFVSFTTGVISATSEYEKAMRQVESSTDVSAAKMAEMREMSKNIYNQNLGENWEDIAQAISTAESVTKLAGKELETATANAIIYRDVFGEEVSQSIKASDTMMRNFGITSQQAYNLLAQGAKNGLNKSDELIDSANEYAPYFATLGFNANQMFDIFSTGLENGAFNLDKVGDAVKEFGIRSKDGSKTSMEAFNMLGMSGEKMTQTFAAGGPAAQKAFNQVVEAIKKVKNPAEQNAIAVGLFGTQAEDLEMNVIASMANVRSQFDMTKMTMEQIKNIKYDSLGLAFQGIKRQIETGMLIPIGERLLPVLTDLSKGFATHMPKIEKFVEGSLDKAGKAFSKVSSLIGPMFKALPKVSEVKGTLSKIKDAFISAISKLSPIIKSIKNIIGPIVLDAVNFFTEIWGQIKTFFEENGAQIVKAAQNIFGFIAKVVQVLAPIVFFILKTVWTNVKGVIQGALNIILGLVKVFATLFTGDWSGLWDGVKQLLGGAVQFLWNLWNLLMIGKLVGSIKAIATTFFGFLKGIGQKIATNVQYYYHQFVSGFYRIAGNIIQTIFKAIGKMVGIVKNGVSMFIQVFNLARTFGVNIFMSIVSAVRNVFASAFGVIRTAFGGLVSTVGGFFSQIWGTLKLLWSNIVLIFTQLRTVMASPFSSLKSIVSTVVSFISGLIRGMFNGVLSVGKGAINGLIMAANAVIGGMNKLNVDIPDWVPGVGGKSFGLKIPKIPMLAKGGITTGPTLAMIGEGAEQEAVLPLSKLESLLNGGSGKKGNGGGGNPEPTIIFNPQFTIQGNADESTIQKALGISFKEFKKLMKQYEAEKKRLGLN
ncbi:phage tail tape measure protein [Ureibacillus chungkukjangi]|uniref:phage tail tape measure protein n=1 Tax=Ureibacillus chungkukjangi TaxID=1202712 RepID=UPI00384A770A